MSEGLMARLRPAVWRIRVAGSSDAWTHTDDADLAAKASRHDYEVQALYLDSALADAYYEGYDAAIKEGQQK